jgi:AraC-like DNA-binding protein
VRNRPLVRISSSDLDSLLNALDVSFVTLTECLVSSGYRLDMGGINAPGIHYNLLGKGQFIVDNEQPIDIVPHTLIIVPPMSPSRIEVAGKTPSVPLMVVDARTQAKGQTISGGTIRRFVAGNVELPEVLLICGFFRTSYGGATDLFANLTGPIVEQFDSADMLDTRLEMALKELVAQEIGAKAMSAALLKQVIVSLLRRSLSSLNLWVERFSILSDSRITRAFAEMAGHPGVNHTVNSLAQTACMSRSAFFARFAELIGRSPMDILRDLRLRQAALQLTATKLTIDQIAGNSGYVSRSSFVRAFRKAYDADPSEYRAEAQRRNLSGRTNGAEVSELPDSPAS